MFRRNEILRRPDDGGGSVAAAIAPSGDTPLIGETSVPGDASSGDSFSGLGGFDEIEVDVEGVGEPTSPPSSDGGVSAPPPASPTPPVATPASPPQPAATTQPATPQTPQAPAASPAPASTPVAAATPAPQEGTPQASPASIPADPGQMLEMLEKNAKEVIDNLAASPQFALSQDEALQLETNPAQAVPRILARTYYQAVNATLAHINNLVPNMIDRHMKLVKVQQENENAFYGKFPSLKPDAHGADVVKFAQIIKAQNPYMTKDDFFAMVGAAVMAKHGLIGTPAAQAPAPVAAQPPIVATPPFAPAKPGASVRTTPVDENPFMGLGQEYD